MEGKTQRQAYKIAYPASKKWNDRTVDNKACELAKSNDVLVRLQQMREEAEKKTEISFERTLKEIAKVAFSDITDYAYLQNQVLFVRDTQDVDIEKRGAIQEIKQSDKGTGIKLYDKLKALEMICKLMGYDKQDNSSQNEDVDPLSKAFMALAKELKSDD